MRRVLGNAPLHTHLSIHPSCQLHYGLQRRCSHHRCAYCECIQCSDAPPPREWI
jgi:hypothetical protein